MGRGGITKQMVKKAKADLIAQGLHPSIYAVRIALGDTGSNSTISRYLKELEEPPKTTFDRLSAPLLVLINEISKELQQEATDKLRAAETKFALEKNQLAEELIEARSQNEQLKRENSELKLLIQKKQTAI